jgi:polyene glycosyltransferase
MDSALKEPVLFVSIASAGILNPLLAVAAELSRQGTEGLWFACTDDGRQKIEQAATKSPINFVSLGPESKRSSPSSWGPEILAKLTSKSKLKNNFYFVKHGVDADALTAEYEKLVTEVAAIKPVLLIVCAESIVGQSVALDQDIPFLLSVAYLPSVLLYPKLPKSFPMPFTGFPMNMNLLQRLNNFLFRLTYPMTGLFALLSSRQMIAYILNRKKAGLVTLFEIYTRRDTALDIICFSVFGVEYDFPTTIENLRMVGAAIPQLSKPHETGALHHWMESNESIVYINFGTVIRLSDEQIASILDTVVQLPSHGVLWKLTKEEQGRLPAGRNLPPNLRLESWLPSQLDVLNHPHVQVFFTHGGSNSIHESLYFGKPVLVLPLWMDCHDLAARVVAVGTGLLVSRKEKNNPTLLANKLNQILSDPSYRKKAARLAEVQKNAGGVKMAADIILKRIAELR